jgi:septum site-determining protein MinD
MRDWVRKAADRVWLFSGFGVDEFHLVGVESLEKLIVSLRNEFPYVIVEVNGGIAFASTVAGLSQGDRIYVPVLPTWASVQDTRDVLAFVSGKWGLDIKRVAAVLNRTRFGSEIDLAAASAALPVRVIGEVGENKFTRLNFMIADFVTPKAEGE